MALLDIDFIYTGIVLVFFCNVLHVSTFELYFCGLIFNNIIIYEKTLYLDDVVALDNTICVKSPNVSQHDGDGF